MRERGGVRHIEALDRARQIESRDVIACFLGQLPQPLALGAEHERERLTQRKPGLLAAGVEPDHQGAARLERGERARDSAASRAASAQLKTLRYNVRCRLPMLFGNRWAAHIAVLFLQSLSAFIHVDINAVVEVGASKCNRQ